MYWPVKFHKEKLLLSHTLHLLPYPAISEMHHKGAGQESVTESVASSSYMKDSILHNTTYLDSFSYKFILFLHHPSGAFSDLCLDIIQCTFTISCPTAGN